MISIMPVLQLDWMDSVNNPSCCDTCGALLARPELGRQVFRSMAVRAHDIALMSQMQWLTEARNISSNLLTSLLMPAQCHG